MDVDGLFTGTWLGRKRPVPWSLSKKNISYIVFDFNITSYFTVNNFVIDVGRRKKCYKQCSRYDLFSGSKILLKAGAEKLGVFWCLVIVDLCNMPSVPKRLSRNVHWGLKYLYNFLKKWTSLNPFQILLTQETWKPSQLKYLEAGIHLKV